MVKNSGAAEYFFDDSSHVVYDVLVQMDVDAAIIGQQFVQQDDDFIEPLQVTV
jgi:hypothetical protein